MTQLSSSNDNTTNHKDEAVVLVQNATCKHGTVRKSHGVELTFHVEKIDTTLLKSKKYARIFHVDFAGDIYSAIPIPGAESLASWFLPLKMRNQNLEVTPEGTLTFTLGAKQLSKETLMKTLYNLKSSGDPLFSLDMIFETTSPEKKKTVFRAITSASKMISSLSGERIGRRNAIVKRESFGSVSERKKYDNLIRVADNRRKPGLKCSSMLYIFRYLFFPLLFACFSWFLAFISFHRFTNMTSAIPQNFQRQQCVLFSDTVPRLVRFGMIKEEKNITNTYGYKVTAPGIEFELPPLPKTRSVAFELGAIWSKLGGYSRENTVPSVDGQAKLFEAAASLLNRPKSFIKSVDQLTAILENLKMEDNDHSVTVAQRVYGLFSTVNVIWLISILGICVSIGPSIYYVLKPLREYLLRFWRSLLENVIQPTLRRCHDWGIFELVAWTMSSWICLDAFRHYGRDAGRYIGITGAGFSILSFLYSTATHGGKVSMIFNITSSYERNKLFEKFVLRFALSVCLPLSLVFKSDFLGFVAIFAAFKMIGFGGWAGRFCYALGFVNNDALIRCSFGSIVLLSGMIGLHVVQSPIVPVLTPLQTPISVFGSLVLHIALLIVSSRYYKIGPHYMVRNAFMWCILILGQYFGSAYGLTGLKNSSSVFTVFYLWTKSAEIMDECKLSIWLFVLFTSAMLWRASLYLHVHPGLVASMFTFSSSDEVPVTSV